MTGKTIGRYEIIRELGIGGMAVVYLGMDPTMLRQVAVKVLPRQFTFDPQFRSRFQREAQVIAGLEHPAIVPVYDFGEVDDQPYIVMRFMPGGSLADRMEKSPLTLTEISNLFNRLAAALDAAHHNGLVHRDLKPANILFDQWGESYLSDFGIVKLAEAHSAYTGSAIIGTPAYMSPEQAKGKALVDGRSDVYSLGIILFELLTQKLPYVSDTPMGQAVAHIIEPVPDILSTKPSLPKACDTIIRRALAKNPEDRYPTAGALASVIAQLATNPNLVLPAVIASSPVPAKPASAVPIVANTPSAQAIPKSQPQKPLTPLPLKSGRPSTGQTILQKARSPWAIALTGATTLIFLGVALVMCIGGALALNYFRATPTLTPSPTPTVTTTQTIPPSATDTQPASATPAETFTITPLPTITELPSETPTVTKTPRPANTNTPVLPSNTPTPACAPSEFFDPLMNRCRTNDNDNASQPTSSSGGGSPPTITKTPPPTPPPGPTP